jgi:hypothetical protein
MAENHPTNTADNEERLIINLALEPYLAQWLRYRFSTPVEFPRNSAENDILEIYLTKPPIFASNNSPGINRVPILVPWFKNKNIRYNNFLPASSRRVLANCIRKRFVIELWNDLSKFGYIGKRKQDIIWAWMESHGIEMTEANWNTIAKIYLRKRNVYREIMRREKSREVKRN